MRRFDNYGMPEIPYNTNKYFLAYGILAAIVLFLWLIGSEKKFSCDDWAGDFRDNAKFHLVLGRKENNESPEAYFYGVDFNTKKEIEVYDDSGWITQNFDKFKVGDTIFKEKGKYTIVIKRNGNTILIPFECNEKIYKD